jgi:hypothetical protein
VSDDHPAIRFHLLPMKANGRTDDLYIKMNSRGRPLTSFERFKAQFEDVLKFAHRDQVDSFAQKVDTEWTDVLWPYRGDDHLIDDEFMRYFRFTTEVCAWKSGIDFMDNTRDEDLAERVYGANATNSAINLAFLFQAWEALKGKTISAVFGSMFTSQAGLASTPLLLFNSFDTEGVDLFHACCRRYGTRQWTLAHTLMLYGVLLRFIHEVADDVFPTRVRILRNLVEASSDEIRAGERNNMPKLLLDVEQLILNGNLHLVRTFNQAQVSNEEAKAAMLQAMPLLVDDLHQLEDHDLLRGSLAPFDLDPKHFGQRAKAFITVFDRSKPWTIITAALLAKGDYSRQKERWTAHQLAEFGAPTRNEPWQELFRGRKGEPVHPASAALMALLDAVASGNTLHSVIDSYLNAPSTPVSLR